MATEVLVKRDLSRSLKSRDIDIPPLPVTITLDMDGDLQKLAKSGKEGFRLQQLTDTANDALDDWVGAFQASIDSVAKKLQDLSTDQMHAKIDELNAVLKKYAGELEGQVDKAVDKQWKAIVARNKELGKYRLVLAAKTGLSLLVMGGNIASLVATAGANALSALSLINAGANLAGQIHRESMDIFKQHERLSDMMEKLDDTVNKDLGGFKDTAKNIAGDISPALGRFLSSTKSAETELKTLRMSYVVADKDADSTVGKINAALDRLGRIEKAGIDARAYAGIQDLQKQVDNLIKGMILMRKVFDECEKQLDEWSEALKTWNERNPSKVKIKKGGDVAKFAVSLAKVVNAVLDMVSAVKTLAA
jgi:hypothetical protein